MNDRNLEYIVAHDYFTQKGGAERVALEIIKASNPAFVATSVCNFDETYPEFSRFTVRQSFLKLIGFFRREPRYALPLLPLAWSSLPAISTDVVICSSSGWSHGLRVKGNTKKIVYCHNPARWLYQDDDYFLDKPLILKLLWRALKIPLILWDKRAAASAHCYIANSTSVAERITNTYGISPKIVFPPVCIDVNAPKEQVNGIAQSFFLTVSRSRGYKGTQIVIDAFRKTPDATLIIVGGGEFEDLPENVVTLGKVSDAQLRWLYSEARALVSLSREDFGLTPIEANAFGTPVLVLRAGGFLDSTQEGVSGCFVDKADADMLASELRTFPKVWDKELIIANAERFSVKSFMNQIFIIAKELV